MAGLGGSSRDDARPFIYPNMKGMPEREKVMRATAEKGKARAAQKKAPKKQRDVHHSLKKEFKTVN